MPALRAPSDVNHDDASKLTSLRFAMGDAYIGVSRVQLVVDQAHSFLLESTPFLAADADKFDRLESILYASLAVLRELHAAMAVHCDPKDPQEAAARSEAPTHRDDAEGAS